MKSTLRSILVHLTLAMSAIGPAAAQGWPQRPIKIIVPFAPGGTSDTVSRRMAQELTRQLGQAVYVENRAGGMGTIGMADAAKAAPDGYTLVSNDTGVTMLPHLRKSLPYDLNRDFAPIAAFVYSPFGIVVNADNDARTLQDLIAHARVKPGAMTYGSGGIGTSPHLAAEAFAQAAGISLTHVPFKGAGEAIVAVASNVTDMQLVTPSTALGNIQSGRLRMLAVSGDHRLANLPDVPTFAEAGLKGYDVWNWIGLWAPAKTPKPVIEKLEQAVLAVMAEPGMESFVRGMSAEPKVVVGAEFDRTLAETDKQWQTVTEKLHLPEQ